ncbi:hypothetical protein HBH53_174530 [Parastagonospora nodorum]|nr:hypothetical protein HBH53_174530 [Parastagonospora nodorum]
MAALMTPLRLGRQLQALPLHKPSCERWRHALVDCGLHLRLTRRATPTRPFAPSTSIKFYSTSPGRTDTDKMQATLQRSHDHIIFSAGQPPELPERASRLLSAWELSASGKGITRAYTFTSFSKAWQFMSIVADECKAKKHHPSWSNLYNRVTIEWTTHRPEGLSIKDVEMAEFCDQEAAEIGLKI